MKSDGSAISNILSHLSPYRRKAASQILERGGGRWGSRVSKVARLRSQLQSCPVTIRVTKKKALPRTNEFLVIGTEIPDTTTMINCSPFSPSHICFLIHDKEEMATQNTMTALGPTLPAPTVSRIFV